MSLTKRWAEEGAIKDLLGKSHLCPSYALWDIPTTQTQVIQGGIFEAKTCSLFAEGQLRSLKFFRGDFSGML